MNNKTLLLIFFFLFNAALLGHWSEQITNVDNNFYAAKIKGRALTMVMERITPRTIDLWRQYSREQNRWDVEISIRGDFPAFTADGSSHFRDVLGDIDPNTNELWVAYVTKTENPKPLTQEDFKGYNAVYMKSETNQNLRNIAMYVTVTTTTNAKLTSHMGISASYEGIMNKIRGLSLDLHSFAAKVSLLRDPSKKFMLNAPTAAMETIIANAVSPGALFVGNRELAPVLKQKLDEVKKKMAPDGAAEKETREQVESSAKKELGEEQMELQDLEKEYADKEISKEKYLRNKTKILSSRNLSKYFLKADNDKIVIDTELVDNEIAKRLDNRFGKQKLERQLALMAKFPPLISVDGDDGKTAKNMLTIFDSDNLSRIWLTVEKGDPTYAWLFAKPFQPLGNTHYILVNLKALADLREIE